MIKYVYGLLIVLVLQLCLGCSSKNVAQSDQLYYDIGAHQGIEKLVDAFVQRIVKDKAILPYFAKSSVKHFKQGFINHLCGVVNGPCKYNGDSMIDIHTGMNINEADFNRVVELLIEAMEDVDISYQSQNKILVKLAVLRPEIIKI
ncbi:group I truncated hemoglobin [Colwellia hornerae]|uniref:Group 1 truncated hemoglobin n=1 Tax=Colwellia hornerae TaxID=89402 RepID=A0A5C6QK30_9GAMM|nr:group 1 truncated hemoglobin [Colwellia hornerae]TWX53379.1 group 1 truncated hemoglobin [Colwellia hornerae]TWX60199.1 group 1 truncated hemoglobin [Colwellia hornerae]TWX69008.1 group 1 truncated hemoglobin [Colwellia hornerae]